MAELNVMITAMIAFDIILMLVMYILYQKVIAAPAPTTVPRSADDWIVTLTEERTEMTELRKEIREDLENVHAQCKEVLKKVSQIATETEMEIKGGSETIAKELDAVVTVLSKKLEEPLEELSKRKLATERMIQQLEREKLTLTKMLSRAEKICEFLGNKVPYEEILEDLQDKKYQDARSLLARGYKVEEVAKELSMSRAEVNFVSTLG